MREDIGVHSRRAVLRLAVRAGFATAAALALAGCDALRRTPVEPAAADPLSGLATATAVLVGRYEATLAAQPGLAARLAPILDDHRAHLAALTTDIAGPSPTAGTPAPRPSVPVQPAAALAALATAEKSAVTAAADACLAAPAWRAPLLGSIAASRAAHVELLS